MIYRATLSAPKSTPLGRPVRVEIRPIDGHLLRAWLRFPDGCAGLVGVRLLDRGTQFLPLSGWITSNGEELAFNISRQLEGGPYYVYAEIYNLDDTYTHTIECRLECSNGPSAAR